MQHSSALNLRQDIQSFYWPLTRRGLFSEILVYAYVKECLASEGILVKPLIPIDLKKYWPILFPSQEFKYSLLTSNLLNPVCPPSKLLRLFGKFIPAFKNLDVCNQYFRRLWSKNAELHYNQNEYFMDRIAQHLSSFICLHESSTSYPAYQYNAIHLRRGDKVYNTNPEASLIDIQHYTKLADINLLKSMPILIFSDSYHHASILSNELTCHGFKKVKLINKCHSLTIKGYNQSLFNKLNSRTKLIYSKSFLSEFNLMVNSNVFICTYSSCVGRAAYAMRKSRNTLSVDTSFSIVQ